MIFLDGTPVVPSFRVPRGEVKMELFTEEGAVMIMHPYDIAQKLGEGGEFGKAFAALNGFLRREIDIKAEAAIANLYKER